jgi:hypothetical protein
MLTKHIYKPLEDNWDEKIKNCCTNPTGETPTGSDCCYDEWIEELKKVNKAYKEAEEDARQKNAEFVYVSDRRDQFRLWYDELTKANYLEKAICDQLNILYCQVEKIGINTQYTVDAIKILFCMIREYYLGLDRLKEKYDQVLACIKCLSNPELVPGSGLMKLIEDYGLKLDTAMASGNDLLKMIMAALSLAEKIDLNIGPDYGLQTVVYEWRNALNCSEKCGDSQGSQSSQQKSTSSPGIQNTPDEECDKDECELRPQLKLPVCNDHYYKRIWDKYSKDKKEAEELSAYLMEKNKIKESLLACKQSLETAIKVVDPKERCK